jgi:predicted MFS family arabinose efflux permease
VVGPGWCFVINGVTFIAVITALLMMKLEAPNRKLRPLSPITEIREGIYYVFHEKLVRTLIFLVGMTGMFGFSFVILFPAWAVDVLGGDVTTNGLLNSARGLGALFSALFIASLDRHNHRGKLLTFGTFAFPISLIIFAFIRTIPMSLAVLCLAGGALVLIFNLANSMVQTQVDDKLRGRVMGIYSLFFNGMNPLGALLLGQIAAVSNEPIAVIFGGLVLMICAFALWFFTPEVRAQR